jgi:hypothetical protein
VFEPEREMLVFALVFEGGRGKIGRVWWRIVVALEVLSLLTLLVLRLEGDLEKQIGGMGENVIGVGRVSDEGLRSFGARWEMSLCCRGDFGDVASGASLIESMSSVTRGSMAASCPS